VSEVLISLLAITLLVVVFAAARGDGPERLCAAILFGEAAVDLIFQATIGPRSFRLFDTTRMLIDCTAAVLLVAVALRANRLYPLGIAAAQLVAVIGSITMLLGAKGWTQAFWAMTQLPVLVQLVLLGAGTITHLRRVERIGPYNSWSPRYSEMRQLA
jgi:hypothetical protein